MKNTNARIPSKQYSSNGLKSKSPKSGNSQSAAMILPQTGLVQPFQFADHPYEYKVTALRECPAPDATNLCTTPKDAMLYWRKHVPTHPFFNPECECLVVLMLSTRQHVKGHYLVSVGTLDTLLVHAREVFRLAIMASAAAIVLVHNHPSGDPSPSDADIKTTRDLLKASRLLKIDLADHLIMGNGRHMSLRELGYFYEPEIGAAKAA